jgi:hypothetical protein
MYEIVGAGSLILAMMGQIKVIQFPKDILISNDTAYNFTFVVLVY